MKIQIKEIRDYTYGTLNIALDKMLKNHIKDFLSEGRAHKAFSLEEFTDEVNKLLKFGAEVLRKIADGYNYPEGYYVESGMLIDDDHVYTIDEDRACFVSIDKEDVADYYREFLIKNLCLSDFIEYCIEHYPDEEVDIPEEICRRIGE